MALRHVPALRWQQTGGPSVALTNATSAIASFTAPSVGTTSVLTFSLTVTDSNGVSSNDSVAITKSHGVTYYNVTLTANEPATVYYSLTDPGVVTNPPPPGRTAVFTVQRTGTGDITLTYWAVDLAYNRERSNSLLLK